VLQQSSGHPAQDDNNEDDEKDNAGEGAPTAQNTGATQGGGAPTVQSTGAPTAQSTGATQGEGAPKAQNSGATAAQPVVKRKCKNKKCKPHEDGKEIVEFYDNGYYECFLSQKSNDPFEKKRHLLCLKCATLEKCPVCGKPKRPGGKPNKQP
jgi:hypothetical protein